MADDLGGGGAAVHDAARAVLHFWLVETPAEQRFAVDPALDRTIAARFGAWRDAVLESGAARWRDAADGALAAVILLDQFSRNIHRGTAAAFAGDALALAIAQAAIARGWDAAMDATARQFLYLPFMHAEDAALQDRSVALFTALGEPDPLAFAERHRAVIARFGRFPSRNAALGRVSTAAERRFLAEEGAGW